MMCCGNQPLSTFRTYGFTLFPHLRFHLAPISHEGLAMLYDGPIDREALIDLDSLAESGAMHYTFFAFPKSILNAQGLPADMEAQRYIAAVQATGVPIGIWLNSPVEDTGYAAVTRQNISLLQSSLERLPFPDSYASDLCEKLLHQARRAE